jgi:hypothetical protein
MMSQVSHEAIIPTLPRAASVLRDAGVPFMARGARHGSYAARAALSRSMSAARRGSAAAETTNVLAGRLLGAAAGFADRILGLAASLLGGAASLGARTAADFAGLSLRPSGGGLGCALHSLCAISHGALLCVGAMLVRYPRDTLQKQPRSASLENQAPRENQALCEILKVRGPVTNGPVADLTALGTLRSRSKDASGSSAVQ